jgi:hypothetical protein
LTRLRQFLIELGRDFCFAGSEFPVQVGGRDFALNLLFFHRGLNCLVAIELMDDEVVEYSLGRTASPALIAQYQTQLPDKALLQAKLHEFWLAGEGEGFDGGEKSS